MAVCGQCVANMPVRLGSLGELQQGPGQGGQSRVATGTHVMWAQIKCGQVGRAHQPLGLVPGVSVAPKCIAAAARACCAAANGGAASWLSAAQRQAQHGDATGCAAWCSRQQAVRWPAGSTAFTAVQL
jgi:hypothetical protein